MALPAHSAAGVELETCCNFDREHVCSMVMIFLFNQGGSLFPSHDFFLRLWRHILCLLLFPPLSLFAAHICAGCWAAGLRWDCTGCVGWQAQTFSTADIIVGPHGAGLTNAAFAPPGVVLVELKSSFHRGSDVFKKIAQGRSGGHVWVNTEQGGPPEHGQTLSEELSAAAACCALALWRQGQEYRGTTEGLRSRGSGSGTAVVELLKASCPLVASSPEKGPVQPGIFGFSKVGHNDECDAPEAQKKCHAGMVGGASLPS